MSDHGPACAHSRVKRETLRHDDGMCHDEYWCRDCEGGTRFVPAREVETLDAKLAEAERKLAGVRTLVALGGHTAAYDLRADLLAILDGKGEWPADDRQAV